MTIAPPEIRSLLRAASIAVALTALSPGGAEAACDRLFFEGFERGDRSGWDVWRPAPCTRWQWQLTGAIDTSIDVPMYDLDLFETPEATIDALHTAGRVVVCYLSAGSWESYRPDAANFPAAVLGAPLDPPFEDERWLDIRRIDLLGPILEARLDLAVAKQCDGVEPDNVDGWANSSGFPLSGADQIAFNRWLAREAHERGLSVGLKNDLDQIEALVDHFDWAINEQCWQYEECDRLAPFVERGKAVFGVEYEVAPATFCAPLNALDYSWLEKNIELDAFRFDCRAP